MKIRKGNWKISLNSLFRFEFRGIIPKITFHEKFEKKIKWILRILTIIGIGTAFLTLSYLAGIIVTLSLFLIEQILERIVFEYTVIYLPDFPDFEIEYEQWLTTGYFLFNEEERYRLLEDGLVYMGPAYDTSDYAAKFFSYIRSWNDNGDEDFDNRICISIIIENARQYSMYFYPRYNQELLNNYFKRYKDELALRKFGKQQQELVMSFIFWHRNLNQGEFFKKFCEDYIIKQEFYFVPFYIEGDEIKMIENLKVKKNFIKIKSREELTKDEIEYHYV